MSTEKKTAAKNYKMYEIMMTQPKTLIVDAWFAEAAERVNLINFIRKKGLYADYLKFQCVNF